MNLYILAQARDHFAAAFFPRRSEWAGAGLLLLCGWILFANPTLMGSSTGPAFDLLLATFSQIVWAKLLMVFGLSRLTILFINGAWKRSPHLRALAAMLSCYFWFQIMLSYYATFGMAFAAFAVFLALEFSNIIVAARDARTVDDNFAGMKSAQQ